MSKRQRMVRLVITVIAILIASMQLCFGADDFTSKVQDFIKGTVLVWIQLVGVVVLLIGGAGWGFNRSDQDKMAQFTKLIIAGAVLFGLPLIINLLWSQFGSTSIDLLD